MEETKEDLKQKLFEKDPKGLIEKFIDLLKKAHDSGDTFQILRFEVGTANAINYAAYKKLINPEEAQQYRDRVMKIN